MIKQLVKYFWSAIPVRLYFDGGLSAGAAAGSASASAGSAAAVGGTASTLGTASSFAGMSGAATTTAATSTAAASSVLGTAGSFAGMGGAGAAGGSASLLTAGNVMKAISLGMMIRGEVITQAGLKNKATQERLAALTQSVLMKKKLLRALAEQNNRAGGIRTTEGSAVKIAESSIREEAVDQLIGRATSGIAISGIKRTAGASLLDTASSVISKGYAQYEKSQKRGTV